MRRSERPPLRRSSRSNSDSRTSLVLNKNNFLDALIISRPTGVPAYATITQSGSTALYAVDASMTLQRVATVDWGQDGSGRSKGATIVIGESTQPVEDIFPATNKLLNGLVSIKTPTRKYTYGNFACAWVENDNCSMSYVGPSRIACYKSRPTSPSSSLGQSTGQAPMPRDGEDELLVIIEFCLIPQKPNVRIYVCARELLKQVSGRDGLTELDHIVLGALLLFGAPLAQRKNRTPPEGWMGEEALQNFLWSSYTRPAPDEIPPLYTATAEAVGDGGLPPYASRISLVDRGSVRVYEVQNVPGL